MTKLSTQLRALAVAMAGKLREVLVPSTPHIVGCVCPIRPVCVSVCGRREVRQQLRCTTLRRWCYFPSFCRIDDPGVRGGIFSRTHYARWNGDAKAMSSSDLATALCRAVEALEQVTEGAKIITRLPTQPMHVSNTDMHMLDAFARRL